MKATILQAEAAMIQLSEQSQAEQNQVVEESKRKIAKLKEQQKKKIAQLKTDHCAVADGIYTRSDGAFFFFLMCSNARFVLVWSKWLNAKKHT